MNQPEEKVQLGWQVPVSVKEAFRDFCSDTSSIVQEDCAGALFIWRYMPAAIREQARMTAKGIGSVDKKFWEQFRAGIELALQARLNTQQQKPGRKK